MLNFIVWSASKVSMYNTSEYPSDSYIGLLKAEEGGSLSSIIQAESKEHMTSILEAIYNETDVNLECRQIETGGTNGNN